jgi:predicted nucleic acid-binding protein
VIVDASVWVASAVSLDVHHLVSNAFLDRCLAEHSELVVPVLALLEAAGAVARRTGIVAEGENALQQMLAYPGLRVIEMDTSFGLEGARLAAQIGLRGADAAYVLVARELGLTLVTLDDDVHRRAGQIVRVVRPT